jgi:hypothetical protein
MGAIGTSGGAGWDADDDRDADEGADEDADEDVDGNVDANVDADNDADKEGADNDKDTGGTLAKSSGLGGGSMTSRRDISFASCCARTDGR